MLSYELYIYDKVHEVFRLYCKRDDSITDCRFFIVENRDGATSQGEMSK